MIWKERKEERKNADIVWKGTGGSTVVGHR
jgi:hypothetical protein